MSLFGKGSNVKELTPNDFNGKKITDANIMWQLEFIITWF